MRRLIANTVFSGLVMLCRLAVWPTRTSPLSVKATIDGVVRAPSAFSITLGVLPSMTATQELVVPRSIPIALAMTNLLFSACCGPAPATIECAGHAAGATSSVLQSRAFRRVPSAQSGPVQCRNHVQCVIDSLQRGQPGRRDCASMLEVEPLGHARDLFRRHNHVFRVEATFGIGPTVGIYFV